MEKADFDKLVQEHKIVLFMKGTPDSPQCGFSAQVAFILKEHNVEFDFVNVFNTDKEALKEYSEWPTFPQLWVNGKLIGGCDIVTQMAQNGELEKVLA